VAIANLDENDPNWERSFAFKHNLNVSLACYHELYKTKNRLPNKPHLKFFFCLKTVEPQPSTSKSSTKDTEVDVSSGEDMDDPSQTINI
jgi:hypothetical protein